MKGDPIVSIIIPVYNALQYTRACLERLRTLHESESVPYEIIVVNDGSHDGTAEFLKEQEPFIRTVHNPTNLGFAAACNRGADLARGPYLLFLNNDTLPEPGWLEALVAEVDRDPRVGVAGARLLYPDGRIQHAGIMFTPQGLPFHRYRGVPGDDPRVMETVALPAVTGACMLVRQDLFMRLEGFDERYRMYYEDVDLCLRAHQAGYRVIYCPRSVVVHFESKSSPSLEEANARNFQSLPLFLQRWLPYLRHLGVVREELPAKTFSMSRRDSMHMPLILWTGPVFDPSGYAEELRTFAKAMDAYGIPFRLEEMPWSPLDAGLKVSDRDFLRRMMEGTLSADRAYMRVWHTFPVFFRRDEQAFANIGRTTFETDRLPEGWAERCNSMDFIWVPTEFNVETFRRAGVSQEKLRILPQCVDTERYGPHVEPLKIRLERGFNFLSIFDWSPRKGWDILLRAYATAFRPDDDVCLILKVYSSAGKTIEQIKEEIDRFLTQEFGDRELPPILILGGILSEDEVPRLYRCANAFVLPSRGEGWGRPLMEAMASGLPTIGTRWGGNLAYMNDMNSYLIDCELADVPDWALRELPTFRGHRWAEPSVEHLREVMRRVYDDRAGAAQRAETARAYIQKNFSPAAIGEYLRSLYFEVSEWGKQRSRVSISGGITPRGFVHWEGDFFRHDSLAHVNRELCLQLLEAGYEVSITPSGPNEFPPELDERFIELARRVHAPLPRGRFRQEVCKKSHQAATPSRVTSIPSLYSTPA